MKANSYPDFLSTDDADELDAALEEIAKYLRRNTAQFLFGAGMSRPYGVPAGADLAKTLLGSFFPASGADRPTEDRIAKLVGEFPFEAVVEAVQTRLLAKRSGLTEQLKALYLDDKLKPGQAHHDFLSVLYDGGSSRLDAIFTTNFDLLIEQEIGRSRSESITEENAKEITIAKNVGKIPVIHLHGLLNREYQLTEKDVFDKTHSIVKTVFETALRTADAFTFIGYSMSDPDFRRIYMEYRQDFADRGSYDKKTCFVSPAKDRFSWRLGSKIWENRGAIWFPLDAESFFGRLKWIMTTHADKEVRATVKRKYGLADDVALDDYIRRTAEILRISDDDALAFMHEARARSGGGHASHS